MRSHRLAELLLQMPNVPVLFTDGTGDILRMKFGPYLEDDNRQVWVDLTGHVECVLTAKAPKENQNRLR